MGLDEEVQEDLGAIVENCLSSIEDGSSSRSSVLSSQDAQEMRSPHDKSTISSTDVDGV